MWVDVAVFSGESSWTLAFVVVEEIFANSPIHAGLILAFEDVL
jgi:hypothetical protein